MSIANLFVTNNYDLFADSLTANSETIATLNTTTVNATTVNTTNLNATTTISDSVTAKGASNQLIIKPSNGNKFNITASNPAADRTYTVKDNLSNANIVTTIVNCGFDQGTTRPSLTAGPADYMIRGCSSAGAGQNNGFLRLAAGGGGSPSTTQAAIDLSGASSTTDMDNNIVYWVAGAQKGRWNSSGLLFNNSTASYTATAMNYFEEYTGDAVYTGALTNTVTNGMKIQRLNNYVTLCLKANSDIAVATANISVAIPTRFIPSTAGNRSILVPVDNDVTKQTGILIVDNSGFITIGADVSNALFTNTKQSGIFDDVCIRYNLS